MLGGKNLGKNSKSSRVKNSKKDSPASGKRHPSKAVQGKRGNSVEEEKSLAKGGVGGGKHPICVKEPFSLGADEDQRGRERQKGQREELNVKTSGNWNEDNGKPSLLAKGATIEKKGESLVRRFFQRVQPKSSATLTGKGREDFRMARKLRGNRPDSKNAG